MTVLWDYYIVNVDFCKMKVYYITIPYGYILAVKM